MSILPEARKPLIEIQAIDNVPTEYEKRHCTDVCCLVTGISFTILMIIFAAIGFNASNFEQVNYPADSDGKLCGYDYVDYQYLYFSNSPNIDLRVCVSQCPVSGDTKLECAANSKVSCAFGPNNKYYENTPLNNRGGFFCTPTDDSQYQTILQKSDLQSREKFYKSLDTIYLSLYLSLALSIVFWILVQCLPQIMNKAVVIVGILFFLAAIVCIFLYQTEFVKFKIALAVFLSILLLLIIGSVWKHRESFKIHSIILAHSTKIFSFRPATILYIIIFLALLILFVMLLMFEFVGFWTSGSLRFNATKDIYYTLHGKYPTICCLVMAIQGIWGLGFLKESFNFCISGNSVLWYYKDEVNNLGSQNHGTFYPLKLQICKHMGSVIGGSFFTAFFGLLDFLIDFIKPSSKPGCYNSCFYNVCCCFKLLDFVRSDTMAFINLTGNPFCNSARYCEYICDKSILTSYSQSTSRIYRLCAHFLIVGIVTIYALYGNGNQSIFAIFIIIIQALFVSTFFISYHSDIAEAIQIIYLFDQEFISRQVSNAKSRVENLERASMQKELGAELSKAITNPDEI